MKTLDRALAKVLKRLHYHPVRPSILIATKPDQVVWISHGIPDSLSIKHKTIRGDEVLRMARR
jgi:hypothetical protein